MHRRTLQGLHHQVQRAVFVLLEMDANQILNCKGLSSHRVDPILLNVWHNVPNGMEGWVERATDAQHGSTAAHQPLAAVLLHGLEQRRAHTHLFKIQCDKKTFTKLTHSISNKTPSGAATGFSNGAMLNGQQ
jgi:hypothetical protein